MKKKILAFLLVVMLMVLCACAPAESASLPEPQVAQMRSICEMATMKCYYRNVAKYKVENAESFLWITKDKHFWIEYAGQVTIGIDASLVTMEVSEDQVTITLPPAKVLGCKVDENSLTKDSFIIAKNSAAITAEDETNAFREAQSNMERAASADTALLANAQQRAQTLLEDYVHNIGNSLGKTYHIHWVYLKEDGTTAPSNAASSAASN